MTENPTTKHLTERILRTTSLIHHIPKHRNLWRRYELLWKIRQNARVALGRQLNGSSVIERVARHERIEVAA